jgi:hypothetical protein
MVNTRLLFTETLRQPIQSVLYFIVMPLAFASYTNDRYWGSLKIAFWQIAAVPHSSPVDGGENRWIGGHSNNNCSVMK